MSARTTPRLAIGVTLLAGVMSLLAGSAHSAPDLDAADPGLDRLAFDMPAADVLDATDRQVFAHYIPSLPISVDNLPAEIDYYTTQLLDPAGSGGTYANVGGFLRSRPLPRAVNPSADWMLEDMETDVRRASEAGFDGFTVDVLSIEGVQWDRVLLLLDAAEAVDDQFGILLAPADFMINTVGPAVLAERLATIADHPALERGDDGRVVLSAFGADLVGPDIWVQLIAELAGRGIDVAFMPILLNYFSSIESFSGVVDAVSTWGGRSVQALPDLVRVGQNAIDRDLPFMQPVAVQDVRPKSSVFDEAGNTRTLRAMWEAADEVDARYVNVITWNDYSESTEIGPSSSVGWAALDINSYYLVNFKLDAAPPIVRDRMYLTHRIQAVATVPTGGQTSLMTLRNGSSPATDEVEVLTFTRDGASVSVTIGASTYQYDAPAGVHAEYFPLEVGQVAATSTAGDGTVVEVVSAHLVTDAPAVQDLQYRIAGPAYVAPPVVAEPDDTVVDGSTGSTDPTAAAPSSAPSDTSGSSGTSASAAPAGTLGTSSSGDAGDDGESTSTWALIAGGVAIAAVSSFVTARVVRRPRPSDTPPTE